MLLRISLQISSDNLSEPFKPYWCLQNNNLCFRSVPETQLDQTEFGNCYGSDLHDDDGFECVLICRQKRCLPMGQRLRVEMECINQLSEPQNESSSEGNLSNNIKTLLKSLNLSSICLPLTIFGLIYFFIFR